MADTIYTGYSNGFAINDIGTIVATGNAVEADDIWVNGLRFRRDGNALRVVQATPTNWSNGWPCNAAGQLCIDTSGAASVYVNGIGRTAAGVTADVTGGAPTSVVNGIPMIGTKMAMVDYAPVVHPFAFSNGFTSGFQ